MAERTIATLCRVEPGALHQSVWQHRAAGVRRCTRSQVARCARHCNGIALSAALQIADFDSLKLFVNTFGGSVRLMTALVVAGRDSTIVIGV